MTPNIVPSTFLWHRLCSTGRKTFSLSFLSLSSNRFPEACFLCFLFEERNHHEKRQKQRIQTSWEHRTVQCSRVCLSRSQRISLEVWIVNEHRVTVHRSDLVELLGLITCVEGGLGQIAKLLAARAEMRMPCAFRTGKYGKNVWTSKSGMVSKWPSRNSKENMRLERARWRDVTHVQRTLLTDTWANARMCTRMKMCGCAQANCATEKCACNRWVYHLGQNNYSFDALQAYCFGINIKL